MPDEETMDQLHYHFLGCKWGLKDLSDGKIKVSTLDNLNDPFELMPYLLYDSSAIREGYNRVRAKICRRFGLLCFSHGWRETLLWSHYADRHKGIALGFEILQGEVIEVGYTLNPKRQQFELTHRPDVDEERFLRLINVKYGEWVYEREARILVNLEECERVRVDDCKSEATYYFLPFDNRLKVRAIVLGCKFDHEKEGENILREAKKFNAWIVRTREGWGDYKIHETPYLSPPAYPSPSPGPPDDDFSDEDPPSD